MKDAPILITGTRKGIGRALAEHYLSRGLNVLGISRKDAELKHPKYEHFSLDICDEAAVVSLFRELKERHGNLAYLVNNAAIGGLNPALLTSTQQVRDVFATNFFAAFTICREAARLMHKNQFGRIVNFTTIMAPQSTAGHLAYVASKAALESMTRVLAREWGAYGITVNAIGPNSVSTDLLNSLPTDLVDNSLAQQAVPGKTSMAAIAYGVDFFLGDGEGRITGQSLYYGGVW